MKQEYCRFLILCEYLIPRFNRFDSDHENLKSRTFIILSFVNFYKTVQKLKAQDFKIREMYFSRIYAGINSSHLVRNLQYIKWPPTFHFHCGGSNFLVVFIAWVVTPLLHTLYNLPQHNAVILCSTGLRWMDFFLVKDEHESIGTVILLYGTVQF